MPTEVWSVKALVLCFLLAGLFTAHSQTQLPELEETRLAAERGDAVAQHRLAKTYMSLGDSSTAFKWFQRAAAQGDTDSQYELSQMLIEGKPKTSSSKAAVAKNPDEALKWLLMLANQGNGSAQLDLARFYEGGKLVNRDMVEAYKWYRLVAKKGPFGDQQYMNRLVLGMTHEEIQEGERRAKQWVPHQTTEEEFLEVVYLKKIVLKGIAGTAGQRLAIVNGEPLAKEQEARIRIGTKVLSVRCLEIRDQSAILSIEGLQRPLEVDLK